MLNVFAYCSLEIERILQLAHPLEHLMADSPIWTVAVVDTGPQYNELSLRWCSVYSLPQIQNLQLYWSWEYFTPEESDQRSFAELPENEQNRIQSTLRFFEQDAYSDNEEESDNAIKYNLDHFSKHYIEIDTSNESVDSNTNGNLSNDSLNHLVFTDYRGREVWNQFN